MSYPAGAELISRELADVPQAAALEIRFHSKYERMETGGEPYEIFQVSYSPDESYDPCWRIEVRPVPRELRHQVKEALVADCFPRIRQRLLARAGPNNRCSADGCGVVFDETHEPILKWRQRI